MIFLGWPLLIGGVACSSSTVLRAIVAWFPNQFSRTQQISSDELYVDRHRSSRQGYRAVEISLPLSSRSVHLASAEPPILSSICSRLTCCQQTLAGLWLSAVDWDGFLFWCTSFALCTNFSNSSFLMPPELHLAEWRRQFFFSICGLQRLSDWEFNFLRSFTHILSPSSLCWFSVDHAAPLQ